MRMDIQDICQRWAISRPTVMKAISERKLLGDKDRTGKWEFDVAEVVRWRGEPISTQTNTQEDTPAPAPSASSELIQTLHDYISYLKEQLSVAQEMLATKDKQLAEFQITMREQLKLLTYAGPAMANSIDEVAQLKQELQKKEEQIEKLTVETAEKVALLIRGQTLGQTAQPVVDTQAEAIASARSLEVERMMAEKPKVQTAADNFDRWGDE